MLQVRFTVDLCTTEPNLGKLIRKRICTLCGPQWVLSATKQGNHKGRHTGEADVHMNVCKDISSTVRMHACAHRMF